MIKLTHRADISDVEQIGKYLLDRIDKYELDEKLTEKFAKLKQIGTWQKIHPLRKIVIGLIMKNWDIERPNAYLLYNEAAELYSFDESENITIRLDYVFEYIEKSFEFAKKTQDAKSYAATAKILLQATIEYAKIKPNTKDELKIPDVILGVFPDTLGIKQIAPDDLKAKLEALLAKTTAINK
jgi:hypothetical protein